MTTYSEKDLMDILEKSSRYFTTDSYHMFYSGEHTAVTRFANNDVTDNQVFSDLTLSLKCYLDQREGSAVVNQLDPETIRNGVKRAENMAQKSPQNPEFVGPPDKQGYVHVDGYSDRTARSTPEDRVSRISGVITECKKHDLTAAGFLEVSDLTVATYSSSGGTGYDRNTVAKFSMTAKTANTQGSGWVLRWANPLDQLPITELAHTAMQKAIDSQNPQSIMPGRYNVVLEPVSCEYLLWNLTHHLGARDAEEGRNFLSKFNENGKPAGSRAGEQVFSTLFTLKRQVNHPMIQTHPFDEEGTALNNLTIANSGMLENLFYDRYWAKQKEVQPTGSLRGMIMEGENRSLEELIRMAGDGILVTRLWYIRNVDWMKSVVTGMTRDGTFRIEGGEIAGPVKNLRFNEELRRVFKDYTASGTPYRYWDFLSPAILVPDFNFTSVTDSI